jgi:hypothetical protein
MENNNQLAQNASSFALSDVFHGGVGVIREWLHGDGRYSINKQAKVL